MMMYRCNAWAVTGGMVSLLVMSAQPALAAVAVAGDGQILFGGSLVAQTCTISVNNFSSLFVKIYILANEVI